MQHHTLKSKLLSKETLILLVLLFIIVAVRGYYYSGPIFGNVQDEGIYLNIIAQGSYFHNYQNFSAYRHANFSNVEQSIFNPADIFAFYLGFTGPEIVLMDLFGFSVKLILYYVIFTSVIEGLFVFLIIRYLSGLKGAIVGTLLFAFIPIDVLFSTHVFPLVPAAALVAAAAYLFIRSEDAQKLKNRYLLSLGTGFLIGLAYLNNPIGLILMFFLIVYGIIMLIFDKKNRKHIVISYAAIFFGAFIAFSITGVYFYLLSGHFLLYPMTEHSVFINQLKQSPPLLVNAAPGIVLQFPDGNPTDYIFQVLRVLKIQTYIPTKFNLLNFSDAFYVVALLSPVLLLKKVKKGRFFIGMFVFNILFLTFFFTNVQIANGKLNLLEVAHEPMYATMLTMPAIVTIGLASENLLNRKSWLLKAFVAALVISVIVFGIIQLNYDVMIYRNTIYDVHALINYIQHNPNETYYSNFYIGSETNIIMGFGNVRFMRSCNSSYIQSVSNQTPEANLRFVSGGALSMDMDPNIISDWDRCLEANLTALNYSVKYVVLDPSPPYEPLQIWAK